MMSDLGGVMLLILYYVLCCVVMPTTLKVWAGVPDEYVRKMQHVAYSFSVFILLRLFSTWYRAVLAASVLVFLAYPALLAIEKLPLYKRLFVDRAARGGELRKQLLYVQVSFGVLIFIYWGLFGSQWTYVVAAAVMAWGFGDAAAALVGKALGRHHFQSGLIDKGKTYEGTTAMVVTAAIALWLTLLVYARLPWHYSLIVSTIAAPVCGVVELFSRRGADTLTVPLSAAIVIQPLIYLFSELGW